MSINILAIESSCDETSAAIISGGKILSNMILSQDIHEIYGGVVPELASRAHHRHIVPIVENALNDAGINKKELDAIGFTHGPGLMGSLLVGISFAKGMAISLGIPLIAVDHMQAHILAHFIDDPKPTFPFMCLTVSGGHTQIVMVKDHLKMEIVGETRDDAVGEAFDKTAKMLGLPYPGGHLIDKYAKDGDPDKYKFPRSDIPGLDYSFSGIKTAVLYFLKKELGKNPYFIKENMNDLCASIQHNLVEMLLEKLVMAAEKYNIREIAIAGGVAANSLLRTRLEEMVLEKHWNVYIPRFEYCMDNAAMIAMAAHFKFIGREYADLTVTPDARLKM